MLKSMTNMNYSDYSNFLFTGVAAEFTGVFAMTTQNSWEEILKYFVIILISVASRFAYAWIERNFGKAGEMEEQETTQEETEESITQLKDIPK